MNLSDVRARLLALVALVTTAALVALPGAPAAQGASRWAAADTATITPGVQMMTKGAQCTANFVYTDGAGRTYVGYAAHCAGKGEATDTDGCSTASYPLGTRVAFVAGESLATAGETLGHGTLVYSSWLAMHKAGTRNANTCAYNDLALVRVDAADVKKVNPSVPFWGGPTGLRTQGLSQGDQVYSYGNSAIRAGVTALSPKTGVSTGDAGAGWSHNVYTATPGIPGDSGSGFLDADGKAFGVVSTIALAPVPGENGIGDLAKELAFAQAHSGISGLRLVKGTEPFSGLGG
jgi:hypothetical protein